MNSVEFGYEQFDCATKREALKALLELVKGALRENDGIARKFTIEKQ